MVSFPSINLVESVIDEVALEGLDGITLEALWKRLAHRFHDPLPLPDSFTTQIWSICIKVKDFIFYELEAPRNPLILFDRYEFVDPDLGTILEPENVPEDIYPHCPIHDTVNGIKGSCSTYYTRKDVSDTVKNLSLQKAVEKYDQKLIIVATQSAREHALIGVTICPTLELTVMQYCFLERVGRARYHGEVTQGKLSLSSLKEDPKSLFYHRKYLLRHKLITKQIHHQKSAGHSCSGSLLHLPRFFVERKPKVIFLAEQVIEILKSKENYVAEYDEIKKKLQIENSIKQLFKTSFFQKVVKTDLRVPYRTLYPNAEPKEWQHKKNPTREKMIRVVQLLTPNIGDVAEIWNKDEIHEDDEPVELEVSCHKFKVPYLKQANRIIEASQRDGVCQGGLGKQMGLTKLQARTLLRNMVKAKIVATYMNDMGRQRLAKYVSKKFEKSSNMSKQFNKEMHKIKELTKKLTSENDENMKNKLSVEEKDNVVKEEKSQILKDTEGTEKNDEKTQAAETQEIEQPSLNKEELNKMFHITNRILYKYGLLKYRGKYKCTSSNLSLKSDHQKPVNEQESETNKNDPLSALKNSNNLKAVSLYDSIKTNLVAQKPLRTGKPVNEIFGFMEEVQNSEKKNTSNITYRLLRRANMIIEAVKEHQVIDDMMKLMKMIYEEEDKEGYDVKIDKKSLIRLLQKLAKDNLVKNIKLTLSANGREKNLTFVCDPNIDTDHTVIKSAVEQAKVKFCLMGSQRMKPISKRHTDKPGADKNRMHDANDTNKDEQKSLIDRQVLPITSKYDPRAGKRYGYSPKFLRMQALHILLYYLIYDHPGEQSLSKPEQIQILQNNGINIADKLAEEISTIYNTEVGWRMFIPPLPKHCGWPTGWALMCDVLLRIPLSIFLKIHNVPFIIPDLDSYLNHPIRKHYLVKDLPPPIRNTLLFGRKYIFNIHQTVTRLCYIGLVQFGPQKLKEKDQVFIYINRRTELMDTISSAPGYHKIEEKTYPITRYNFDEIQVVEKYWYDMWNTCINTSLGGRLAVQGKDIVLEVLSKKTDMLDAIVARTPEEAAKMDNGQVPGDHKGAAGIDSAFFAHLKRNWYWGHTGPTSKPIKTETKSRVPCQRDAYLSKIKAKPLKFTEFSGLKKVSGPTSVNATDLRKKTQTGKTEEEQQKKLEVLTSLRSSKQKSFVRRVLPRKSKSGRRLKYDEIDYRALQRMHKLRVDWDAHEDNILLVCKVAMMYLCPNPRKQVVTFTAVRDVLRSYSFSSYNKTSRACQRRLLYMFRQPQTINSVTLGVEEIKQNYFIKKRFDGISERIKDDCKNSCEYEKRITEVFKDLVTYIAKKYYNISEIGPKEPLCVPRTIQEFNIFYKLVHPTKPFQNQGFVKDVRNVNDIHAVTINSVIHSSMCCGKDRRAWAYQLFKVYQQYPEILLRNAMNKIRADQMVTVKRNHMCAMKKYGNCMPMSSSQYQLSTHYVYKFQTKWPYNIYSESYEVFVKLVQWYSGRETENQDAFDGTEILPVTGGTVSAIHDYIAQKQIDFDIEIPEQIIMLDPRLQEKDETYFRIAQRYQDILAHISFDHIKLGRESTCPENGKDDGEDGNRYENEGLNSEKYEREEKEEYDKPPRKKAKLDKEEDNFSFFNEVKDDASKQDTTSYVDLNYESDEGNNLNLVDDDEESNTIKFQDGTKITLNKDDVEHLNLCMDEDTQPEMQDYDETKQSDQIESTVSNKENLNSEDSSSSLSRANKRRMENDENLNSEESACKKPKLNDETELDVESMNSSSVEPAINVAGTEEDIPKETPKETKNILDSQCSTDQRKPQEFTRVSSIIKNVSSETNYLSPYSKTDDTSDIQKKYTRIALLRTREELSELTVADSHHAHEYFVVNMFKVFYLLESSQPQNSAEVNSFREYTLPADLLPLRLNVANELIKEISKSAVFPKDGISYADYKKAMVKSQMNWNIVDSIYKFIREKKELGASAQELLNKFQSDLGNDLYNIVTMLTENHIFLRSGVTTVRYIHHRYADPWLIHSYKIYRLERESLPPIAKGSIYVIENSNNTVDESKKEEERIDIKTVSKENVEKTVTKDISLENVLKESAKGEENLDNVPESKETLDEQNIDKNQSSDSEEERDIHTKKRMQRKRTCLLPQRDIYRAAKQLDFTTAEEIRVVIKPWIRVDGVLNRRVLDRMLGAILTYCLTHPGIILSKVQNRFVPALQPFHTRELVEMLVKLGCLERKHLKRPHVTLFSKPDHIRPETDNVWANEEEIMIEPAMGATLKFGIFLSTKMYTADFIS